MGWGGRFREGGDLSFDASARDDFKFSGLRAGLCLPTFSAM